MLVASSLNRVSKSKHEVSPPRDETLPEFDPAKFTPGYVPKTVSKGEDEYMIVVSGVKDTGLCGGYWGNTENLGSRRRSKPVEALQIGRDDKKRRGKLTFIFKGIAFILLERYLEFPSLFSSV